MGKLKIKKGSWLLLALVLVFASCLSNNRRASVDSLANTLDECTIGEDDERTMCEQAEVAEGEECNCETQKRACENGVWGEWSGITSYQYSTCDVVSYEESDDDDTYNNLLIYYIIN